MGSNINFRVLQIFLKSVARIPVVLIGAVITAILAEIITWLSVFNIISIDNVGYIWLIPGSLFLLFIGMIIFIKHVTKKYFNISFTFKTLFQSFFITLKSLG